MPAIIACAVLIGSALVIASAVLIAVGDLKRAE